VYKDAASAVAVLYQSSELEGAAAVWAFCGLLAEGAGFEDAPGPVAAAFAFGQVCICACWQDAHAPASFALA